ncbi:unnamed protein product, partial [Meganyctiphanes norvegica]
MISELHAQFENYILLCEDQEDCKIYIYSANGTLLKSYSFRNSLFLEKDFPLTNSQHFLERIYYESQLQNVPFIQEKSVASSGYWPTLREISEVQVPYYISSYNKTSDTSLPLSIISPKDLSVYNDINRSLRSFPVLVESLHHLQKDIEKTRIFLKDASYVQNLLQKADTILAKGIIGERNLLKSFVKKTNNIHSNGLFGEMKTIQNIAQNMDILLKGGLFGERQIFRVFVDEVNSLQRAGYLDNQKLLKSLANHAQNSIENGYFGENNILAQCLDHAEYHLTKGWVGERKLLQTLMNKANALLTDGILGEQQILNVLIKTSDELLKNNWVSELSLLHGLSQQFETLLDVGCFGDWPVLHAIIQQTNLLFTEESVGEKQILQAVIQFANALLEDGFLGEQPVLQTILSQMDFILTNGWMEKRQIVQAILQLVDASIAEGWFGNQYVLQALVQVADTILSEDSTSRYHLLQAIIQVVDAIVLDGWIGEQAYLQAVLQIVNAVLTYGWLRERILLQTLIQKINTLLTDCLLGKQPFLQIIFKHMHYQTYHVLGNEGNISINKNLRNSQPYQRWLVRRAMIANKAKERRRNHFFGKKRQREHRSQKMCSTNRNPFYRWQKDDSPSSNFCKTRLNPNFSCKYTEKEVPEYPSKSNTFQSPINESCHDNNFRVHHPNILKTKSKLKYSNNVESKHIKETNYPQERFSLNSQPPCVSNLKPCISTTENKSESAFIGTKMLSVPHPLIYEYFFYKNSKHKTLNPHKISASIYPFYRCFSLDGFKDGIKLSSFE